MVEMKLVRNIAIFGIVIAGVYTAVKVVEKASEKTEKKVDDDSEAEVVEDKTNEEKPVIKKIKEKVANVSLNAVRFMMSHQQEISALGTTIGMVGATVSLYTTITGKRIRMPWSKKEEVIDPYEKFREGFTEQYNKRIESNVLDHMINDRYGYFTIDEDHTDPILLYFVPEYAQEAFEYYKKKGAIAA